MAHMPTYSYDKEADVLYISFAPGETPTAAVELNDNILLRFNLSEKRAVGLTLMDFSVSVPKGGAWTPSPSAPLCRRSGQLTLTSCGIWSSDSEYWIGTASTCRSSPSVFPW